MKNMEKIDCKTLANTWLNYTKERVQDFEREHSRKPCLVTFLLNDDPASQRYVRNKHKDCILVGIENKIVTLDAFKDCTTKGMFYTSLVLYIENLNNSDDVDAIMIQRPVANLNDYDVINITNRIIPEKDVDCLTTENIGLLAVGDRFMPATPRGIMTLFRHEEYSLSGKDVVIRGRSNIVGKPLALAMINAGATVRVENSKTKWHKLHADVIVDASGTELREGVKCDYFVDVSTFLGEDGKLRGSLNPNAVALAFGSHEIGKYTSVPGGVGLLTRAALCANIMDCAEGNL